MSRERLTYEPPRAMRFTEQASAAGACDPSGSGDAMCWGAGSSATFECRQSGSTAGTPGEISKGCLYDGNAAVSGCIDAGNGFVE